MSFSEEITGRNSEGIRFSLNWNSEERISGRINLGICKESHERFSGKNLVEI